VNNIVPFGKYRGRPVEALANDRDYCDWLMAQAWFRERYGGVYTLIVNNFAEPSETPEHNALQARFLNDALCIALLHALRWTPAAKPIDWIREWTATRITPELERDIEWSKKELAQIRGVQEQLQPLKPRLAPLITQREALLDQIQQEGGPDLRNRGRYDFERWLEHHKDHPLFALTSQIREISGRDDPFTLAQVLERLEQSESIHAAAKAAQEKAAQYAECPVQPKITIARRVFETRGWDVVFTADAHDELYGVRAVTTVALELKPSLGDDYPAVLRQMKANLRTGGADYSTLLLDQFVAAGATLDQVRAIFAADGIRVLALTDVAKE